MEGHHVFPNLHSLTSLTDGVLCSSGDCVWKSVPIGALCLVVNQGCMSSACSYIEV